MPAESFQDLGEASWPTATLEAKFLCLSPRVDTNISSPLSFLGHWPPKVQTPTMRRGGTPFFAILKQPSDLRGTSTTSEVKSEHLSKDEALKNETCFGHNQTFHWKHGVAFFKRRTAPQTLDAPQQGRCAAMFRIVSITLSQCAFAHVCVCASVCPCVCVCVCMRV